MRRALLLVALGSALMRAQEAPAPLARESGATELGEGAKLAAELGSLSLDPSQAYLVRDLSLVKDDIKIYFNDGYLIFAKPVSGERFAAVFTGNTENVNGPGNGEVLLLPPRRSERESLAKYTGSPNLNEHFTAAVLLFSDGTAESLLEEIRAGGRGRAVPESGEMLAGRWSSVLANLAGSFVQRLASDKLAPARPGGGFFFAALSGEKLGNFDVLFDPLADDQILAGRLNERGTTFAYDVWTSFPARAIRQGSAQPVEPTFTAESYAIDAQLDTDLWLRAVTRASLTIGELPVRSMLFGISRAEQITAVRVDGMPAEAVFRESLLDRARRPDENDVFLVLAPQALAPGSKHEIEFEHEGAVIADRGSNVYSVGARANWYPRSRVGFAQYSIAFRYPRGLTLVSAGEVVEDREDGPWRVTRRETKSPIRVAGFNLGNYARTGAEARMGNERLHVEVYANRGLDPALRPRIRETILVERVRPAYRPGLPPRAPEITTARVVQTAPLPPDPLGRLDAVAKDVSESLEYFGELFGAPAIGTLTVAPMPGTSGQGFPGLIYLSTLAYLNADERPEQVRGQREQTFFSDLMVAHEVAHQWWGNLVTPDRYRDEWIMEALANYSSLLWLEKKKGRGAMNEVLADFRNTLVRGDEKQAGVESFGPLTWGYRLESAEERDTWRAITYEKGAWVFHMMRQRLGDAAFFAMLKELRRRYEFKSVSTEELQALMAEFLSGRAAAEIAETFFDNWVWATGVPRVQVRSSTSGRAPSVRVNGTVTQSGAPEGFAADVPLRIEMQRGDPRVVWVRTGDSAASFTVTVPQAVKSVGIVEGAVLSR